MREFFEGFVNYALLSLHINSLRGANTQNQFETMLDALGRARPHLMMSVWSVLCRLKRYSLKVPFCRQ
ncbi:MAG: hypothetical protein P8Q91_10095 [Porticoccaceae bacterium]|nr:hypothetical protein [Porticoccaceae bacterium]